MDDMKERQNRAKRQKHSEQTETHHEQPDYTTSKQNYWVSDAGRARSLSLFALSGPSRCLVLVRFLELGTKSGAGSLAVLVPMEKYTPAYQERFLVYTYGAEKSSLTRRWCATMVGIGTRFAYDAR